MKDVRVRVVGCRCGSWGCPSCARVMGPKLESRLVAADQKIRSTGRRLVFVTLTVDAAKFPAGPLACWQYLRKQRQVSRAVHSFAEFHGIDVAQCWVAKMEIQERGWIHYHVLLWVPVGLKLPMKGAFDAFWKWGFSNVQHGGVSVGYVCKYAAKGGTRDGGQAGGADCLTVSGLPNRNVHWVMPSRGFWSRWGLSEWSESEAVEDERNTFKRVDESEAEGTMADRVARCARSCAVLVEPSPGVIGRFELPVSRRSMWMVIQERAAVSGWEWYDSGSPEAAWMSVDQVAELIEEAVAFGDTRRLPSDVSAELWRFISDFLRSCSGNQRTGVRVRCAGGPAAVGVGGDGIDESLIVQASVGG